MSTKPILGSSRREFIQTIVLSTVALVVAPGASAGNLPADTAGPAPSPAPAPAPVTYADLGAVSQFAKAAAWTRVILPKEFEEATLYIRQTPAAPGKGAKAATQEPSPSPAPDPLASPYQALSARCTHKGCTVGYDKSGHIFLCPCHQGQFDDTGKNVSGPPRRPLDALATKVDANTHLLVEVPQSALPGKPPK